MRAYPQGQPQKDADAAKVATAIGEGSFLGDGVEDPRGPNSLLAVIAGKSDPRAYERVTGVPGGLGLLADEGIGWRLDDLPAARALAAAWVDAPRVGADLSAVPGEIALWLLDEARRSGIGSDNPAIVAMLADVCDLHRGEFAGDGVSRSVWTEARTRAIAMTDAFANSGPVILGKLIETLAWPPLTARTILVEGVRVFADIVTLPEQMTSGMTQEERAETSRTMNAIYEETASEREANPESYDFGSIFEARFPLLHARFLADLELSNSARNAAIARCVDQAILLMRAAPVF
jgi:hypothetical protein